MLVRVLRRLRLISTERQRKSDIVAAPIQKQNKMPFTNDARKKSRIKVEYELSCFCIWLCHFLNFCALSNIHIQWLARSIHFTERSKNVVTLTEDCAKKFSFHFYSFGNSFAFCFHQCLLHLLLDFIHFLCHTCRARCLLMAANVCLIKHEKALNNLRHSTQWLKWKNQEKHLEWKAKDRCRSMVALRHWTMKSKDRSEQIHLVEKRNADSDRKNRRDKFDWSPYRKFAVIVFFITNRESTAKIYFLLRCNKKPTRKYQLHISSSAANWMENSFTVCYAQANSRTPLLCVRYVWIRILYALWPFWRNQIEIESESNGTHVWIFLRFYVLLGTSCRVGRCKLVWPTVIFQWRAPLQHLCHFIAAICGFIFWEMRI